MTFSKIFVIAEKGMIMVLLRKLLLVCEFCDNLIKQFDFKSTLNGQS